jgi:hypothetical protein
MEALAIIIGLVLLFFGRNIFWVFLGVVGFVAGMKIATFYLAGLPPWVTLAVAFTAGIVGVILAIFFQAFAISVAGFVSGAYLAYRMPDIFGYEPLNTYKLVVLFGALTGTILALAFFDWALVIFSSLIGAVLIVSGLGLSIFVKVISFAVLASVGVAVQAKSIPRPEKER